MKNLEIQTPTTLPDGSTYQNVYALDNGGARKRKFVCRISQGEKINDTIKSAKDYISNTISDPSFSKHLNDCGQYR